MASSLPCAISAQLCTPTRPSPPELPLNWHLTPRAVVDVSPFSVFLPFVGRCNKCGGKGKIIKHKCKRCSGKKVLRGESELDLYIEKGMPEGYEIVRTHLSHTAL